MNWKFQWSAWPFKRVRNYEWDRVDVYVLWILKIEVDRAWIDDRQYNPMNWWRVRLWRIRHPIWFNSMGFRIDRLMVDRKYGIFWLSRDPGPRGRVLLSTKRYRRGPDWTGKANQNE